MEQESRGVEQYIVQQREKQRVHRTVEDRGRQEIGWGEIREKRNGIRASRCGIVRKRWWNRAGEMVE